MFNDNEKDGMGFERFLKGMNTKTHESWDRDRQVQEYSDSDARLAAVLTRLDTALNFSVNGYNAKLLESIRIAVWILVAIEVLRLAAIWL